MAYLIIGLAVDKGFISPYFVKDSERQVSVCEWYINILLPASSTALSTVLKHDDDATTCHIPVDMSC